VGGLRVVLDDVARWFRFRGEHESSGVGAREGDDGDADRERGFGNGVEELWVHDSEENGRTGARWMGVRHRAAPRGLRSRREENRTATRSRVSLIEPRRDLWT